MPKSLTMRKDNSKKPPQSERLVIYIVLRILREIKSDKLIATLCNTLANK